MFKKKRKWNSKVILWMAVWLSSVIGTTIIVPGILVNKIQGEQHTTPAVSPKSDIQAKTEQDWMIPVYLTKKKQVETVPLEKYVKGVLAAEMPVEFELEALKAQAMAARTYIVRKITDQDFSNVPVKEAWVTDTIAHQAYMNEEDLRAKWDSQVYKANMDKIDRAVTETVGKILLYDNRPINATFFSTSNGYTENSEDYWADQIPYLRSVPSPWDIKLSPRYRETVTFPYKTILQKLGVSSISAVSTRTTSMKVLEWSKGHRIKRISIGGKVFSGREVREALGLSSSQFDWKRNGAKVDITTYGYGHGVGLSQWGANGMAKEGKTAEEIVTYYYTGISIGKASGVLPQSKP